MTIFRILAFVLVGISALGAACASANPASALESSWATTKEARARLLTGEVPGAFKSGKLAFVEIELAPGWKTYWRTPGDAGGLPPAFDWSGSSNLSSATVLYPAPSRLTDKSGDTIGYKGHVIFPVEIIPENAAQPTAVKLVLQYGICKDICIPAEASLDIEIAPEPAGAAPEAAAEAFARVPQPADHLKPEDPVLLEAKSDLASSPLITLKAKFPDAGAADVFIEAPDSLYVPLPVKKSTGSDGVLTFEVDLAAGADIAALKGKTLTATLVSATGASVATFPLK